jgi:hypothetical protein
VSADGAYGLSVEAFERGQVDAAAFDHEAHVYAAWLYTGRFALPEAIERFTAALRRLTVNFGAPEKYHETISWFFLLLIAERRHDSGNDWTAFRRRNDDLFEPSRHILERYYRAETLAGEKARRSFVLPDRSLQAASVLPRNFLA